MTQQNPLLPIRRVLGESVTNFKDMLVSGRTKTDRPDSARALRFENLEERRVLSANGLGGDGSSDSGFVAPDDGGSDSGMPQEDAISYVKLLVNGRETHYVTPENNRIELTRGDALEVIEIGVDTTDQSGVFAAEGYLSKIGDLTSASLIDYNDGRFSDPTRDFAANGGDGVIRGLNNQWDVQDGWDRMTINLMHYDVESTEVAGRFFIHMQVGKPDFEYDTEHLETILDQEIQTGDAVTIPARWFNNLQGNFHNYAEVDIYHASDTDKIVWAGALAGNASAENVVEGEFLNDREDDEFTRNWTPELSGEYILKYYLDPEHVASEANEDNNKYEIRVNVAAKPAPIAIDDTFDVSDRHSTFDVMENDIPTHDGETHYEDGFESESLSWTVNPNGTDTATTGIWEATDPVGTSWNGVQLQLEDAANGTQALVTGGKDDGSVGYDDVDNGVTSALSQAILVPEEVRTELSFNYTFAHLDNSSNEDFFRVSIVGANETRVVLEERGDSSDRAGEWQEFSMDVSDFAGQKISILVEAADNGRGSLVEAGIDDVRVETPTADMSINSFSQGENGQVTLNEDGTLNYVANQGFTGVDTFTYTLTDGESVSNTATVTVNVESKKFDVEPTASGDEDSAIELQITSDFDRIRIEGVPQGAALSQGDHLGDGVYELTSDELDGLTISPPEHSDQDFQLTVMPLGTESADFDSAKTIDVTVNAVIDGGTVEFSDFGIVTGKKGDVPVASKFLDNDGSESHRIVLSGLPDFVTLSNGEQSGSDWILTADDLEDLEIKANKVDDVSDWERYDNKYVFTKFTISFVVESFEENSSDEMRYDGEFEFFAFQRHKR